MLLRCTHTSAFEHTNSEASDAVSGTVGAFGSTRCGMIYTAALLEHTCVLFLGRRHYESDCVTTATACALWRSMSQSSQRIWPLSAEAWVPAAVPISLQRALGKYTQSRFAGAQHDARGTGLRQMMQFGSPAGTSQDVVSLLRWIILFST